MLVIILFMLSLMALPLQLAFIKRRNVAGAVVLIIGIFTYLMHTKAIEQSYAQFEQQLADTALTGNLLVIQVIESIGGILLSIYLLSLHHGEWIKKGFRFFKYVPGIMPFIALFYLESYLFLNVHGMKFHDLGLILAVGFMIALWGGMYLFRWLLRDYDILLEMKYFLHIIQMIVALIISVHLFGLRVPKQTVYLSFQQTGIVLGAGLMVIAMDIFYYHFKVNRLIKKQKMKRAKKFLNSGVTTVKPSKILVLQARKQSVHEFRKIIHSDFMKRAPTSRGEFYPPGGPLKINNFNRMKKIPDF